MTRVPVDPTKGFTTRSTVRGLKLGANVSLDTLKLKVTDRRSNKSLGGKGETVRMKRKQMKDL